jgi:hypothetical protein
MTNNNFLLNRYLAEAITKTQIKSAKIKEQPLSIVALSMPIDQIEADKYQNILIFINSFLLYSPAITISSDTIIFFLHEMKLHTAVKLIKNMQVSLRMQYQYDLKNVSVTAMESEEDSKSLINRVLNLLEKSKQKGSIVYATTLFSFDDSVENLKRVFLQEPVIKIYGFYKEAPMIQKGTVLEYDDSKFIIHLPKDFIDFIRKENSIYLEHPLVGDIMEANIITIDSSKSTLLLSEVKFLDDSPVHRKNIRVTPHKPIKAQIGYKTEYQAEGIVYDISKESLLITFQLPKVVEIKEKDLINKKFDISFMIETGDGNSQSINTKASIFKIIGNQIVFSIYPTSDMQRDINSYIEMCQKLLLLEAKGIRV